MGAKHIQLTCNGGKGLSYPTSRLSSSMTSESFASGKCKRLCPAQ